MSEQTCLFIGGCADGRRVPVDDRLASMMMRATPSVSSAVVAPAAALVMRDEHFSVEEYREHLFFTERQRFRIFALAEMDDTETMQALLDGYRRKRA